jgi:hypothetical protein
MSDRERFEHHAVCLEFCVLGVVVTAEKFRRRAAICMRFVGRGNDPDMALRFRLMASEYLAKAEELEHQTPSGAGVIEEPPPSLDAGQALPSANLAPPKD